MKELSELDVHVRAQRNFEHENPGRIWRALPPSGATSKRGGPTGYASLTERQAYLLKARHELRAERTETQLIRGAVVSELERREAVAPRQTPQE